MVITNADVVDGVIPYALGDTAPTLPKQSSIAIDWATLVASLESVTIIDSATLTFSA